MLPFKQLFTFLRRPVPLQITLKTSLKHRSSLHLSFSPNFEKNLISFNKNMRKFNFRCGQMSPEKLMFFATKWPSLKLKCTRWTHLPNSTLRCGQMSLVKLFFFVPEWPSLKLKCTMWTHYEKLSFRCGEISLEIILLFNRTTYLKVEMYA